MLNIKLQDSIEEQIQNLVELSIPILVKDSLNELKENDLKTREFWLNNPDKRLSFNNKMLLLKGIINKQEAEPYIEEQYAELKLKWDSLTIEERKKQDLEYLYFLEIISFSEFEKYKK